MRLVFMGTPEFAVPALEYLVNAGYEIAAVYTQPDTPSGRGRTITSPPVKKTAQTHGLAVFQPISLKQPEEVRRLVDINPDVVVVAAFGQLLPQAILDIPCHGCLNIHPSLLPRYRGPSPVAASILAGDDVTGVSIMLLDMGMDTGPVLAQESMPIIPEDTTGSLTNRLARVGAQLLLNTLPVWVEHAISPTPQNDQEATYSTVLTKKSGELDWHTSAVDLARRVRAMQPWPGSYTRWRGKLLKIVEAAPLPELHATQPGQVVIIERGKAKLLAVQTREGLLELLTVQLEGKKAVTAEEFLRGQKDIDGTLFPS